MAGSHTPSVVWLRVQLHGVSRGQPAVVAGSSHFWGASRRWAIRRRWFRLATPLRALRALRVSSAPRALACASRGRRAKPGGGRGACAPNANVVDARGIDDLQVRLVKAGLDVPTSLLQRCCAAAAWDVDGAYVQVRDIMRWRKSQQVDGVLEELGAMAAERWYRDLLHYEILGLDRKGRAILVESVGQWDMEALNSAALNERARMLRSHICVCETLLRSAQEQLVDADLGERRLRIPGFVAVLDMADIGAKQNPLTYPSVLAALNEVSQINARYYPGAVEHVFVVNTPPLFSLLWNVVAPYVFPSAGLRVDVLGPGEFGPLVRECGSEQLPLSLGGSAAFVGGAAP